MRLVARAVAVLDANVFLELASCHDLVVASEQKLPADQEHRAKRAAAALRLMIYLHETQATTLSYGPELARVMTLCVPPESDGLTGIYVRMFLYFTREYLTPSWKAELIPGLRDDLVGNRVDDALLDLAAKLGVPVISNEGHNTDGTIDLKNRMRKHAAARNVQVMRPADYYQGKLRAPMLERFMHAFNQKGAEFLKTESNQEVMRQYLSDLYDFYHRLLTNSLDPAEWQ